MGNKYKKKVTPEASQVEVDAPYHPSAKLGFLKVKPKSVNQKNYLDAIDANDMVFGIGPAGTGKTLLAVAKAVTWLAKKGNRLVLVRPAVEAGERLGFLPGSMQDKVDPYLRPLYDALYDLMPPEKVDQYLEKGIIEVAPLAFMRGRAQPLRSSVLTPTGWKLMGSLEVGDAVVGSDGSPTTVLGVYPQGVKPVYRVTTTDGASTLASDEHLWSVLTASDKRRDKPYRVIQTKDMVDSLRSAHQYRYELPLVAPVNFGFRHVPLDPYLLGALLGDGCITGSTTPSFTTADSVALIAPYLDWMKVVIKPCTGSDIDYTLGTYSYTKFIPEEYLYNSLNVRLGVLQGLLDTDGGVVSQNNRTSRIGYTTTSEQLKDGVIFLVRSLGGTVTWRERKPSGRPGGSSTRPVYHRRNWFCLDIRLPDGLEPFRLSRKSEAYHTTKRGRPVRSIKSIEFIGDEETQCIKVAAGDSLYVTDDFILTHNTLNNAFVILDEAQNTTTQQMKMLLTRMGMESKVVITGDITQIDLPISQMSGLIQARKVLHDIEGIHFQDFDKTDVVRHALVQRVVEAYENYEE